MSLMDTEPVPEEVLEKVLYAGRIAPSAMNRQPWRFYVVKDREKLEELSKIHRWAWFIAGAPVAIVVTVDGEVSKNHFVEDGSCAALSMWIAASNLGLASCWVAVYSASTTEREEKVREILQIPENYRVICILPLGYPSQEPGKKEIKPSSETVEIVE